MKIKKGPYSNYMLNSQFFWLQFVQPGYTQELPSSINWMKLWRYNSRVVLITSANIIG